MEYNTCRNQLIIPEYGRNIQKMVKHVTEIENAEERQKAAETLVEIMIQASPSAKEIPNAKHKMWNHLFYIAEYNIDVKSPYGNPVKEQVDAKPDRLKYPENKIRFRYYGKTIEKLIKECIEIKDEEEKMFLTKSIANIMKRSYSLWNQSTINDELVKTHLEILSDNKLILPEGTKLNNADVIYNNPQNNSNSSYKKKIHSKKFIKPKPRSN